MNAATADEFEPPPTAFNAFVVASFSVVCIFDFIASITGLNRDTELFKFIVFILIEFGFWDICWPLGIIAIIEPFAVLLVWCWASALLPFDNITNPRAIAIPDIAAKWPAACFVFIGK